MTKKLAKAYLKQSKPKQKKEQVFKYSSAGLPNRNLLIAVS